MSIRIAATGSYVPDRILNNRDLENMVETSDEWIRTRTGIVERRIALPEQSTGDMAYLAACRALESSGFSGEDLDAIIVSTVTPDYSFPSTGCLLQKKFKAAKAMCFDLEAACCGLLYGLEVAHGLMVANPKRYSRVLICGAEKLSAITDWNDRNTCVLFGDGACAVLLENVADGSDRDCLLASDIHADGDYSEILKLPAGGSREPTSEDTVKAGKHYIHMAGREVFKLAVNAMVDASRKVLQESGIAPADLRYVIPHQANIRIIDAVAQRLEITPERQLFVNLDKYGNTSSASIGIALDECIRNGSVNRGDKLLLTAFGGGLTWGAALLEY